jgi:hypothetical protein
MRDAWMSGGMGTTFREADFIPPSRAPEMTHASGGQGAAQVRLTYIDIPCVVFVANFSVNCLDEVRAKARDKVNRSGGSPRRTQH